MNDEKDIPTGGHVPRRVAQPLSRLGTRAGWEERRPRRTRANVVGQQDPRWSLQAAYAAVVEAFRTETDACRPEHLAGTDHSRSGAGRDLQLRRAGNETYRPYASRFSDRVRCDR